MATISKIKLPNNASYDIKDDYSVWGGRNLLLNTRNMPLGNSNWAIGQWRTAGTTQMTRSRIEITDSPIGKCYGFQMTGTQTTTSDTSCFGIDSWQTWVVGDYYTISLFARVTNGTGVAGIQDGSSYSKTLIDTNASTNWGTYKCISLTTNWQRVWVVYKPTAATSNIYIGGAGTNATIQMCGVKLEKGNKPTDWSPALEDIAKYIGNNTIELYSE